MIFNKTDLATAEKIKNLSNEFNLELERTGFIPFLKISALKDRNTDEIFRMIDFILDERNKKISDKRLTGMFKNLENESAVYFKARKFKVKFIRQIRQSPPYFLVFSNMDIRNKTNITRYIENNIRKEFGFIGTPIFFKFKF